MTMKINNPQTNETASVTSRSTEQANISGYIVELAQVSAYKQAIISLSGRDNNSKMAYTHLTFRQFNQRSSELARGLQQAGVIRGTKTALQMQPGIDWFSIVYALLKIGAVPILIQPSLGYARIAQCIKAVEPEVLISEPKYQVAPMIYSSSYQSIHLQISTHRRWFSKGICIRDLQKNDPTTIQIAEMRSHDPGIIIFSTSCESDKPKPTILSHGTLNAIVELMKSVMAITPDSTLFTTFPLFMILAPTLGIRNVIPVSHSLNACRMDPRLLVENIWDHGITHLLMSPTRLMMLAEFLREEGIFLPSIQRIGAWGEPYPAQELQRLHFYINEKTQIFPLYGMTEAPIVSTIGSHKIVAETQIKTERGFGICQGKVLDDLEMRIIEVNDRPIDNWSDDLLEKDGGIGELVIKGDAVSRQYSNSTKDDALYKIPDGKYMWHRTGDVGWLDSRSNFWFCGRKQDRIIISEEETLYTIPCEAVFMQHERVYRCIIVGVGPVPFQTPVLIVELAPGDSGKYISTLTHELTHLAQAYPHTGNIKNILFRKRFPVHSLYHNKINRKQLTIWAAKKLGKSLPDEAPDSPISNHVQAAIYPPSLEDNPEAAVLVSNGAIQAPPEEKTVSEHKTDLSINTADGLQQEQSLPEDTDDNSVKPKLINRVKSFFGKMIPKPDDDPDDTVDIEELPEEEYITADQYVAISESKKQQEQTMDQSTLLSSDFSPSFDSVPMPAVAKTETTKG
ncbi:MAG: peptide synthase [Candidatus Magnetoglobus multicellularis str. Araruama]|uniref:Peptide synthase n=1 Tax=Candidatus Magnetoglobus multicellularis str. Araruama TaxID=890399 RepID=A0A1V1PCI2_9BACT|nr:MAG: peptide synthase [Candidatus Magnetoglobus multicellularis str. Araruama]